MKNELKDAKVKISALHKFLFSRGIFFEWITERDEHIKSAQKMWDEVDEFDEQQRSKTNEGRAQDISEQLNRVARGR